MNNQDHTQQRTSKIIIELNKTGFSYLTHNKFGQAFQYFKQSQKIINNEIKVDPENPHTNKLAGIVYNNLACYYKKINKPKISLIYLEKALQIQVNKVEDWAATASTHLNICAIYSFIKDHQSAASHAKLALQMLQKITEGQQPHTQNFSISSVPQTFKTSEGDRSVLNLKMLSHYNFAIELEHLKRYEQSIEQFLRTKQCAKRFGKKYVTIIMVCEESISRMRDEMNQLKQKLIGLVTKKRVAQEKGYYSYMRKNKKNFNIRQSSNDLHKKSKAIKLYEEKPHYRTNAILRLKTSPKTQQSEMSPHKNKNSSFSQL